MRGPTVSMRTPRPIGLQVASVAYLWSLVLLLGAELARVDFTPGNTFHALARITLPWPDLLEWSLRDPVQWRPAYYVVSKLAYGAFGVELGPYVVLHLATLMVLVAVFVAVASPRDWSEAFAVAVSGTALLVAHTSRVLYLVGPVNAYPLVAGILLLVLGLLRSTGGTLDWRWAAVATLVAVFGTELGALVFLAIVIAWVAWPRRRDWRTAAGSTAALLVYFVLRFATSSAPTPPLFLNETGFGFETLQVEQLHERFSENPVPLYAYNLASTTATLLTSEPNMGRYELLRDVLAGEFHASRWVDYLVTALASILIALWLARPDESAPDRRWVALVLILMAANCALGYLYVRDRIVCVAGVLHALLLYYALVYWLRRAQRWRSLVGAALLMILLVLVAGVGVRFMDTRAWLREMAWQTRDDWERHGGDIFAVMPPELYGDPAQLEALRRIPGVAGLAEEIGERVRDRQLPPRRRESGWLRALVDVDR